MVIIEIKYQALQINELQTAASKNGLAQKEEKS